MQALREVLRRIDTVRWHILLIIHFTLNLPTAVIIDALHFESMRVALLLCGLYALLVGGHAYEQGKVYFSLMMDIIDPRSHLPRTHAVSRPRLYP